MSSRHNPADSLADIIENAERIAGYITGLDAESFAQDGRTRDAVERCVERICEAAHRLGGRAAELMPGQPWADIRGMGNQLRHGYDRVDRDFVWQAASRDVPALVADARRVLERLRPTLVRPLLADTIHPARRFPYDDLEAGLAQAHAAGLVYRRNDPATGLVLFVYTPRCVYEDGWNDFTLLARGLILDRAARRVVATPFPKFFNAGERRGDIPDLPFEAFEKLDGSLIVIFHHAGRWRAATKGAFDSSQALWAQARLDAGSLAALIPGTTYLAELVGPENRIVVRYADAALVMLAAYAEDGRELSYDAVVEPCAGLGWRAARRQSFASVADMVSHAARLPSTEEGFVIRFADGLRLKLKGAEYRRIHALISRCTPLAMWEAMAAGDDLDAIRRDLPEEFRGDFDAIVRLLHERIAAIEARVAEIAAAVAYLSDKELGLSLASLPDDIRPYLFGWRKSGGIVGKGRETLMRAIRPTGNDLPGYQPSYAVGRMLEETLSG